MWENIIISENNIAQNEIERVNELMLQLSPSSSQLDFKTVRKVMENGFIFSARNNSGKILGMASLIPARKLFAYFGTVEDVIVDEKARGLGLGKSLTNKVIEKAKELQMKHLDLTSSPKREAANKLYQSAGFEKRDTNVYRMKF